MILSLPLDVQREILSFCGCAELLTLRRTSSRSVFSADVLDREFCCRVPAHVPTRCITDVWVYFTLLHHSLASKRALICKTAGRKLFRLRVSDLDGIPHLLKRNHRYANAAKMVLFSRVDLFIAALKRHGSLAQLREYSAQLKQRQVNRRLKKQAIYHQMALRRKPFCTRIDSAYKKYLERATSACSQYENDSMFDDYRDFCEDVFEEYRSAFGIDRDTEEHRLLKQDVDERNKQTWREWERRN